MDIKELKELIDATIYPNGEKKIKASSHQSMLHEIVDYTNENITTINNDLEEVKNTLESQGNDVEQLKESSKQAELNDAKVNQKIDNLASNIVGLGGDIKGSVKGADIIELPNIAINGVSPKAKIEGLTLVNSVKNGDFKEGVSGWGTTGASITIEEHVLKCIITSSSTLIGVYTAVKGVESDDLLYSCVSAMHKYPISMSIGFDDARVRTNVGTPNIYDTYSAIFRNKSSNLLTVYVNTSDNPYSVGDSFIIKNIQAINLTQMFGKGNEPTKEWCDKHIKGYIDGVQSVQTPLRISGEATSYINSGTTLKSALKAKDYIENGTLFKNVFTTKEFKKDDIRRQSINESLVNTYAFYFDIEENVWLKDGFSDNTNRIALFSDGETYSCVGSTIATDVEDIVFFVDSGKNYIVLKVNKTKIDKLIGATPLDKFKAYMGNRSLIINYQANTEQVKLDTSGVVTTKPNGTIFIENIKNVTDFYTTNGLEVNDFKELVSIYKYEGSDLVQLDASKAVFTTTLKHPDLIDGDLVFFEYKYLDSPLCGDNEIEYFNKNNVLQSENGKLWQKVEKASNEGVLTTELKEIV